MMPGSGVPLDDDLKIWNRRGTTMITEEQIRELAHSIWEQEGRPNGKDVEYYFRAKKMLEERESSRVIELAPPLSKIALEPPPPTVIELGAPLRSKRRNRKKR
jgi:hypothetical protein